MPPPATLADYWMAMYSRKWIILAVAVSAMLFALGISHMMPAVYEAKASFYFPTNYATSSFTGASQQKLAQPPLRPLADDREAGVHIGVLKSQDMAARVSKRFPQRDPAFFKRNVDFVTSPQFFLDIYVRDRDPALAAQIANAYVEEFRAFHADTLKAAARRSAEAMQLQLRDLEKRLADKTAAIRVFQQQNNVVSTAQSEQLNLSLARELERQRDEIAVELSTVQARLGARNGAPEDALRQPGDDAVLSNPRLDNLRVLKARQAGVNEQIEKLHQGARGTISNIVAFQTMENEKKVLQELMVNVEMNLAEARLQSESPNVEIVQVQTAEPPRTPGFPLHTLNAIVGLILGFAAGCYAALLLEYLRNLRLERAWRNMDDSLLAAGTR